MKLIFTADWFIDNFQRGAELNDDALLKHLALPYDKILCRDLSSIDKDSIYILGNFTTLSDDIKKELQEKGRYIIYEHDHKYCMTRNPFTYISITKDGPVQKENPSGKVPENNLTNLDFYKNAHLVICLTSWHEEQLRLNVPDCRTTNIHGSLWTFEDLDFIDKVRETTKKTDKCAIFNDQDIVTLADGSKYRQGANIKNKQGNIKYCKENKIPYRLVPRINDRKKFLKVLAMHSSLCFFPEIPETCSRLLTEARMLGLDVYTDFNSGAAHEYWFKLSGQALTDYYRNNIIPVAINLFKAEIDECNKYSMS